MRTEQQIRKIKEVILNNKNGFTINLNGKFVNKDNGYFISLTNIKGRNLNLLIKKALYIQRIGFKNNKNIYLGGWVDKQNNFFLDLTIHIKDLNLSKEIGIKFNQQAIFNIKKLEEVYLK